MAITNLDRYRPFRGSLRRRPLRFWAITAASIRVEWKKKLPIVLLYSVPAIATAIFGFFVYTKFAAEAELLPDGLGGGPNLMEMLAQRALKRIEVRNNIAQFNSWVQYFALLPAAWYGSTLFATDFKAGAHQLYFSRPISRLDYFLGKFLTSMFYSGLGVLVPGLVICIVAVFASPDWSFLTQEWTVIVQTFEYSAVWVFSTSAVALCVSSLSPRRSFAMVGFIAVFMIPTAMGLALGRMDDAAFYAISPLLDYRQLAIEIFDMSENRFRIPGAHAWWVITGMTVVSLVLTAFRLRRLEVVA